MNSDGQIPLNFLFNKVQRPKSKVQRRLEIREYRVEMMVNGKW